MTETNNDKSEYGGISSPKKTVEQIHLANFYVCYQAFVTMAMNTAEPLKQERIEILIRLAIALVPNAYKQNELINMVGEKYRLELDILVKENGKYNSSDDIPQAERLKAYVRACMVILGMIVAYNNQYMVIEETQVIGI